MNNKLFIPRARSITNRNANTTINTNSDIRKKVKTCHERPSDVPDSADCSKSKISLQY